MGKKNKQSKLRDAAVLEAGSQDDITRQGKRVIGAGVAVVLLGFIVLSRCDAMGGNWAARLSPFLVLGGYALVGLGIFLPENRPTPAEPPTPSSGVFEQKKTS